MKIRELIRILDVLSRVILRGGQLTLPIFVFVACTAAPELQPSVETATQVMPSETIQASPSAEIEIAATLTPSSEMLTTEIAATLTPTVVDISMCTQATIIFTAKASTEEGTDIEGLYSICADGTDLRKILSNHEVSYGDFDISPDGHSLALSTSPRNSDTVSSTLSIVNLDSLIFSELITKEQARFGPRWSADGQYLGYLVFGPVPSETPPETYIEIVHLESGTVSDIHPTGLNDFDWSSDNSRVVFGAWVPPDEYSLDEYMVFMGEIACDEVTKKCQLTQITRIPDVGQYPSWIPNTQTLVSAAMRFSDTGNRQTLLLTNVQSGTVQEIDPGALDPKTTNVNFPQGSVDGKYIGFIGSGGDLYVIDLDRMSIQNVILGNEEHIFEVIRFGWIDSDNQ